jgi:CheY-like chemotaxis protein
MLPNAGEPSSSEPPASEATGAEPESPPPDSAAAGDGSLQDALDSFPDLVQFETGEQAPQVSLEPISVTDEVRKAVAAYRPRAETKGLVFKTEWPEAESVRAPLNEEAFQRVLGNLIENAVKFTEEGGVGVKVMEEAHAVYVCVADTGIGVEPAFREKIFEDFTQEAPDATGSGSGLAIARRLTQQMDGAIEVKSPEGRGTVFTLSFPRIAPSDPPSAGEPAAQSSDAEAGVETDAGRPRLLLVEDNRNTRALARHVLRADYDVTCADSAEAALVELQEAAAPEAASFEAFLFDINLGGGGNGVDLLQRLHSMPAYADAPAIAFTARAMEGDEERLRAAGFDGYLTKPFAKEDLLAEVREVCDPVGV